MNLKDNTYYAELTHRAIQMVTMGVFTVDFIMLAVLLA